MARKRKRRNKDSWFSAPLNPEIKRGVIAVFLFILAILAALSFFDVAGVIGRFIDSFFAMFFGVTKYLMPIVLIIWAVLIEREDEYEHKPTHVIGVALLSLSATGVLHLFLGGQDKVATALAGDGGGLLGVIFSVPLLQAFGLWVSTIILICLFFISLLFLFNTSLSNIFGFMGFFSNIGYAILRFIGKVLHIERLQTMGVYDEDSGFARRRIGEDDDDDMEEVFDEDEESEEEYDEEEPEDEDEEDDEETKDDAPANNPFIYTGTKDLPKISLLTSNSGKPTAGDIKGNAQIIKETLAHFGIEVSMGEVRIGPTVTQYTVKPMRGTKLSRITALNNDLALELAAHPIRIEAPIPGKSLVGIEVPNQRIAMVTLKELLQSKAYKSRTNSMMCALGKDVAGHVWFADLPKMPHMLVAGATGSGKTVCLNTIILSLLFQNTPETLRFIFVDPKRVELTLYDGIPHLLTPVITDVKKTINALRWTISEMERRFDLLSKSRKRDISSYNKSAKEKLPYLVFVVDELADLMTTSPKEIEAGIVRLAQMARAVGIHLLLATQRPSVDIITGTIKANIPARVAFSVASLIDSRTILDSSGAEKLLGRGDMLFLNPQLSKPKRLQGAFISEDELKAVVRFLKEDEPPQYDHSITEKGGKSGAGPSVFGSESDHDDLFEEAKELIISEGKASASFLQRRLRVGYARAARILDELEEAGIVGPARGSKPREILITETEIDSMEIDEEYDEDDESLEDEEQISDEEEQEDEDGDDEEYEDEEEYEEDEEEEEDSPKVNQ